MTSAASSTPTLASDRLQSFATLGQNWWFELNEHNVLTFSAGQQRPPSASLGYALASSFLAAESPRLTAALTAVRTTGQPHTAEYWLTLPHGLRQPMQLTLTRADGPNQSMIRGMGINLAQHHHTRQQLQQLTGTCTLTGLPNRRSFLATMARAMRHPTQPNALVVLDVVRFSALNQALGEDLANTALQHVANLLTTNVRSHDVAARLDADRFAVLFQHLTQADLPARLSTLSTALATHPLLTPQGPVTLACTMAALPLSANHSASAHLTHALATLASSKVGGAGRLTLTRMPAGAPAPQVLPHHWHQLVQAALAAPQQHVHLHFQPIQPLGQSSAHQDFHEVLVRLTDSTGQLYPPAAWAAAVHQFGLAEALDDVVTHRAITTLQHWHQRGRQLRLAVNVHPSTLISTAFISSVTQAVQQAGLPHGALVLELTESTALPPMPQLTAAMRHLRTAGVTLALDDVGTGHATLNLLKSLQLDYLKIDGAFIRQLTTTPADQALVKALVAAAKPNGTATIAEMIEDAATIPLLQSLGVTYGQGFHLAPPSATLTPPPLTHW